MRDDPIGVFCSPRGGSSMVTGVLAAHGIWTGKTFGEGSKIAGLAGYPTHENIQIRNFMKQFWPLDAGNHAQDATRADLRGFCDKVVPSGVPWLFKGLSEYYMVWEQHFPRMVPVFVFRDPNQAVETHVRRHIKRSPEAGANIPAILKFRQNAARIVSARYKFMNGVLLNRRDAYRVDADRVVNGDLAQLVPVLAQYGKTLDHRLAMDTISPDTFHTSEVCD